MLQLLVAEPDQRLERDLVAEPVVAAQLEHLGADEALDQPEHVGVSAPLDLAEKDPLGRREEVEPARQREPVGQELVGAVEPPAANDVGLDVPAHPLRGGNATGEPIGRNGIGIVHYRTSFAASGQALSADQQSPTDRVRRRGNGRGKLRRIVVTA